jgi:zinc transport system substrate-binding protein
MKKIKIVFILFFLLFFIFSNTTLFSKEKPIIAVSINPIKLILKEIVKDKIKIYTIVPPGASPHTFQLTIRNRLLLKKADTLFIIGANLENWLNNPRKEFEKKGKLFVFSNHINDFIEKNHNINPHFWLSVKRVIKILPYIKDQIIKTDSKNKDFYISNFNIFLERLKEIDKKISNSSLKLKNKNIVVFHPVWNYFLKDYNFNIIANIERKAGEIPTLKRLLKIISLIRKNSVRIIITEPGTSLKWVQTISNSTNTKIITLDPLGFDESIKNYENLIVLNFAKLKKSLL